MLLHAAFHGSNIAFSTDTLNGYSVHVSLGIVHFLESVLSKQKPRTRQRPNHWVCGRCQVQASVCEQGFASNPTPVARDLWVTQLCHYSLVEMPAKKWKEKERERKKPGWPLVCVRVRTFFSGFHGRQLSYDFYSPGQASCEQDCTTASNPEGISGREWCYVEVPNY